MHPRCSIRRDLLRLSHLRETKSIKEVIAHRTEANTTGNRAGNRIKMDGQTTITGRNNKSTSSTTLILILPESTITTLNGIQPTERALDFRVTQRQAGEVRKAMTGTTRAVRMIAIRLEEGVQEMIHRAEDLSEVDRREEDSLVEDHQVVEVRLEEDISVEDHTEVVDHRVEGPGGGSTPTGTVEQTEFVEGRWIGPFLLEVQVVCSGHTRFERMIR